MPQRRYDIDWLRVIAVLIIFFFHNARFYDPFPWHIKDTERSLVLASFVGFVDVWAMPLFFLLAGVGSWYALEGRTGTEYVVERVKRLLIPLYTVGAFILLPPQLYWDRVTNAGFDIPFLKAYPLYFTKTLTLRPSPFFGSFWSGHLWFLKFLFLICLFSLPLLLYFKRASGRSLVSRIADWCDRSGGMFLFVIPLCLVLVCFRGLWQGDHTWADLIYFMVFFLMGYIFAADARFTNRMMQSSWAFLLVGIIAVAVEFYFIFELKYPYPGRETYSPLGQYLIFQAVMSANTWAWIAFILSMGARYLNKNHRLLSYSNEAVLPFYILHQTAILLVGWYIIPLHLSIFLKYTIIGMVSFILIMLSYEFIIKRINTVRFLFGMRLK